MRECFETLSILSIIWQLNITSTSLIEYGNYSLMSHSSSKGLRSTSIRHFQKRRVKDLTNSSYLATDV